ncbi:MAG: hypothetical protein N2578_01540 [Bdellovibrionaceae bacterium]|nr:hypothetical protein [Pseudobdellovibrionaceae bacterium]
MSNKNSRTVFSTDPKDRFCPECGLLERECLCVPEEQIKEGVPIKAALRIEKSGRGGKTVTVVDSLPKNKEFVARLAKELKSKCGVGGTFGLNEKCGYVEIQGDLRDKVAKHLTSRGFIVRGV